MLWAGLLHCSEPLPTTNPVRSIELPAFDAITAEADFNGLVVVMASWCPPCHEELPIMTGLYEKYKKSGIRIVALSIDAEGPKAVQPLIDKLQVSFPVYWGGTPALEHYRIVGIPSLMVYKSGKQVQRIVGLQSRKTTEKIIRTLLSKSG